MARRRVRLTKAEKQRKVKTSILIENIESYLGTDLISLYRIIGEWIQEYSEYDDVCIEHEYYGYDGGATPTLVGLKQESDEEYKKRIEKLKEAKRKQIEKEERIEKKLYRDLRKKYGDR